MLRGEGSSLRNTPFFSLTVETLTMKMYANKKLDNRDVRGRGDGRFSAS